jgi:protein-S-isoprenylcysteine O-methyltransferase Ste14
VTGAQAPGEHRTMVVQIGRLKLTGLPAAAVLVALLASIVGLVVYSRPSLSNWPLWVSGALWILFIGYWSAAARSAAATKSSESAQSRRLHQLLMYGALLLLFIPVPGLGWRFLPPGMLPMEIGLGFQGTSFLLAVWARRHLGRNWSGAITVAVEHQLIRSGPYRVVRHPIYSAMLGMFAGTALVSGRLHALLGVVLIVGAYWRKIRLEEQSLRGVFGTAYEDYQRGTWAVVPGVL